MLWIIGMLASSQRKNKWTLGNKMPLTEKDQLFITLLRLRRGFNLYTLAHFYSVSESYIRKMFTTWIMFLYHHFKDLREVIFPDRDAFQHLKPKVFKYFKNIRCSVDCTEFFLWSTPKLCSVREDIFCIQTSNHYAMFNCC